MIKWRTEKVRPTYVPTFCVGLDGMCRVLLGRCCRLIEDAVSTIYSAFIFRRAVAPPPPQRSERYTSEPPTINATYFAVFFWIRTNLVLKSLTTTLTHSPLN